MFKYPMSNSRNTQMFLFKFNKGNGAYKILPSYLSPNAL